MFFREKNLGKVTFSLYRRDGTASYFQEKFKLILHLKTNQFRSIGVKRYSRQDPGINWEVEPNFFFFLIKSKEIIISDKIFF